MEGFGCKDVAQMWEISSVSLKIAQFLWKIWYFDINTALE